MSRLRSMSPWASLAATLIGVMDKVIEFVTTTYSDPRFIDDVVFEIVSHLDSPMQLGQPVSADSSAITSCTSRTPMSFYTLKLVPPFY